MIGRRRGVNPWLGMLDLVFLLCTLFFVTTVVSMRRLALVEEVADDENRGGGSPIVVRLETDEGPSFALVSAGDRPGPGTAPLIAWLESTCASGPTPVEIACSPESTHVACKRGVLALRRRARSCAYRY